MRTPFARRRPHAKKPIAKKAEKLTCPCDLGELTCAPRASARGVRSRLIASVPFETREVDMQFPRRSTTAVTIALVALLWLAAAGTRADDFPSRIIRVVVAFPAGGPTDLVARILADRLKPLLGQNVIVENRPGANGAIGAEYVAKGEADGHLLFLTTVGAVAVTPHLSKPNYDTLRDFAPITLVARPTTILVVRPDTPVNSAKELAALAREKPATIPFASTGSGSVTHLALELYQSAANVKFLHVPYRGAAPALTDLLGGQVLAMFADNWYGLLAPAKTPPAVVAKLHDAVVAVLDAPDIREKLLQSGATPAPMSSAEFGKFLSDELARWGRVVREKNIKED